MVEVFCYYVEVCVYGRFTVLLKHRVAHIRQKNLCG